MKKTLTYLLLIIAVAMIVIGIVAKILPPALTGVGFIIIALIFILEDKKSA